MCVIGFGYTLGVCGAVILGGLANRKVERVMARHFEDFRDEPDPPKVVISHTYHHQVGNDVCLELEG